MNNFDINNFKNKYNSIIAKAKETAVQGLMKAENLTKEEASIKFDNLVNEQENQIKQMYGGVDSIVNKFRNGAY